MTSPIEDAHSELTFQDIEKEPKVKFNFDGCYNYEKLKKEGLVDEPEFTPENDPYGGR
mgnify:CR=1 FL=1